MKQYHFILVTIVLLVVLTIAQFYITHQCQWVDMKHVSPDIGASVSINCARDGINHESNNYNLSFRQNLVLNLVYDYCRVDSDGLFSSKTAILDLQTPS